MEVSAGMVFCEDLPFLCRADVGIDFGGLDAAMAQEFLDAP